MSKVVDKNLFFESIGYEPHSAGQRAFHASSARFRVAVCGRRYGKSTMAGRDVEPELMIPNRRYWIIGPTYDLGEKEFRVIWDDLIVRKGLGRVKKVKKAYNKKQGDMYIEFPWRTRIEVRSADHPEGLVGEALDGAIMSEAAKHRFETWDRYIRPSLADKRGWATFPTTPEGFNWLYTMWQHGRNPDLPDYESWKFPSWENRVVFPGGRQDPEILLLERTTTPEWFLQEIGADFASFVGKIYGEFDETVHVRPITYNPTWENYLFFDFGFVHPFVALDVMVDAFDRVYIWREHYRSYIRVEDHCKLLKARPQPKGYHVDLGFGDSADPEAAATISESGLCHCMAMPEAKENWREGVDLVKKFLQMQVVDALDEYGTPKTEPWLFIDGSCTNTIREFNNYKAADTSRSKSPKRESNTVGAAERQDDHTLDALRYGLVHRFLLGVRHHLLEVVTSADLAVSSEGPSGEAGYFTTNVRF